MNKKISIYVLYWLVILLLIASIGYSQPKISGEIKNVALNKSFISSVPHYSSYDEILATDSDTTTFFWSSGGPDTGDYFMVDLGQFYSVERIFIIQSITRSSDYVQDGELQYSMDGTDWSHIIKANSKRIDYTFETSVMRYFRIYVASRQFNWVQIAEMQAFSAGIPDSIYFGDVNLGKSSETSITILNVGNENLKISDISTNNSAFEINDSSFVISPDSNHKVNIFFKPTIGGLIEGTLTIHSNDPENPEISIYLYGIGLVDEVFGITSPFDGIFINYSPITVTGFAIAPFVDKVLINGISVEIDSNFFSTDVNLIEGKNQIVATAFDSIDTIIHSDTIEVNLDTTPPIIRFYKPYSGQTFLYSPIEVLGKVFEINNYELKINDNIINTTNDTINFEMEIEEGINIIKAIVTDTAGNIGEESVSINGRPPDSPPDKLNLYIKLDEKLSKFPYKDFPPPSEQWFAYRVVLIDSSRLWKYPLSGDIEGTNYTISVLAGCNTGNISLKGQLILRRGNEDIILTSTPTFGAKGSGYYFPQWPYWISPDRKEFNLTGTDIGAFLGDTLILKVINVSRKNTGYVYPQERSPLSNETRHSWITTPIITSVEFTTLEYPKTYKLSQNYPNPFNQETIIEYQLPNSNDVSLKIYNIMGQLVKTLVNRNQTIGYYSIKWNGKNDKGDNVSSGIYLYILQAKYFVQTKKMILLR